MVHNHYKAYSPESLIKFSFLYIFNARNKDVVVSSPKMHIRLLR